MKKNKKIIIIGLGFVGLTLAIFLALKKFTVIGIDIDHKKLELLRRGFSPFYEPGLEDALRKALNQDLIFTDNLQNVDKADIIFVTVGTPSEKNGSIDLKYIKQSSNEISKWLKDKSSKAMIVFKSTILPGTFESVIKPIFEKSSKANTRLAINPEFLREGSALQDTIHPHVVVIGGDRESSTTLEKFYKKIYSKKIPIKITNHTTAELIKYANNSFLAAKISFINTIANICQRFPDTNVDNIAEVIGMDPRIGPLFLKAGPGYGGSCFPKDVRALISLSKQLGTGSIFLDAIHQTNLFQAEAVIELIKKHLKPVRNSTISILGLSFKENSDDVRESVSITLIQKLLSLKVKVKVHDPMALNNTRAIFDKKIIYCDSITNCLKNSDCAIILTPWKQYSSLSSNVFSKMKNPMLIDTRRLLANKKLGIKYIGLGIGENFVS